MIIQLTTLCSQHVSLDSLDYNHKHQRLKCEFGVFHVSLVDWFEAHKPK